MECSLQVGDNRCLLQSLKDSPYFAAFSDRVQLWEGRLMELDELLLGLNQIQRRWVYLEPIFGGGALPQEQGRFKRIDKEFRWASSCWYCSTQLYQLVHTDDDSMFVVCTTFDW